MRTKLQYVATPLRRLAVALPLVVGACVSAGSDLGFGPDETRVITVDVYLDRDGSRTPTAVLDTVYRGARVALFARGSVDTFKVVTTNNAGRALFSGVPFGQYRIEIVPSSIGDSIEVQAIRVVTVGTLVDTNEVRTTFSEDTARADGRLGYPEFSVREARNLPLGRRVFIRGVILAGVQSFRDTTSHVTDSSLAIRLTRVTLKGGLSGNNPGDSVSVLGVTASRGGQPTLDNAAISRFNTRPEPIPLPVSTGTASTASNGTLDAALIRLTGATISDTATVSPDFRVTITDGTGSLQMILDANLPFPRTAFTPGRSMQAVGVLVPDGVGGWVIKPRQLGDVVLN
jgi:hypothetical protein